MCFPCSIVWILDLILNRALNQDYVGRFQENFEENRLVCKPTGVHLHRQVSWSPSSAGGTNLQRWGFWRFKQSNYPAHVTHLVSTVNSYSFPSEPRFKHTSGFHLLIDYYPASFKSLAWRNNTYKWLGIIMLAHSLKSRLEYRLWKQRSCVQIMAPALASSMTFCTTQPLYALVSHLWKGNKISTCLIGLLWELNEGLNIKCLAHVSTQ